jgi:homospermidine synthase
MITRKSWMEFRNTGLLFLINQILHAFGWAIVIEVHDDETEIYPARVDFRGFSEEVTDKNYKKISKYLLDNSQQLYRESSDSLSD